MNGVIRQSIFRDESKLDINYIPAELPHRENQLRLLAEFFNFILQYPGKMAQRVILTGDVGTGKTALAQNFGTNLTSQASRRGIKFRYVHINCREYRGSLQPIMHRVVTAFQPNYPARGYGAEEILAALMQVLDEEDVTMILALDEFDSLIEKEGSDAVYKLTRIQEMRQGKPQRLSFIFIMRNLDVTQQLDESARSTLQRSIIRLERYGKAELVDILVDRVDLAFETGTVGDDIVNLVAELSYSETGNARFGIELLWRAGKYADTQDASRLDPEHVRQAVSSIVPSMRRSELESLGLHERLFLLAVARYFIENKEAYASLTEIERTYRVICEEYNETPNSHTQIYNYTQRFSALGILKTQVAQASIRGRTTQITLPRIPAMELERQLSESISKERRH